MTGGVERAREALSAGLTPVDVYAGLAAGTGDRRATALWRRLATGRLPEAYALLVRLPVREDGDATRYWALLTTAGEGLAAWLPPGDEEAARLLGEARERCAREAAALGGPAPTAP
ncbi:hypothetical protein [Streptomyces sp. NPDC008265]|uniref:hypothetical protein n=1 Tax=Streptomyces sp. NPDC008265 TaxID=3364824 RepID=UPI0036EA0DDE